MSVLNRNVSYYPGITKVNDGKVVNLLTLLKSNKHEEIIKNLRGSSEDEQIKIKENLPCFTPTGIFSGRSDAGLIKNSGLAAVDLDSAEDYDPIDILNQLKQIDCIAYAGLSCRGKRIFCIIPFKYPYLYDRHYTRLIKSFIDLGLPMGDECHRRLSQPRFVSHNNERTHFFNHNAKTYDMLIPEQPKLFLIEKKNVLRTKYNPNLFDKFQWCVEQINRNKSFCIGGRHNYILNLVRYCNLKGISKEDTLFGCKEFIEDDFTEKEIRDIINYVYKNHIQNFGKHAFY